MIDKFLEIVKSKLGCGYVLGSPRKIGEPEVLTQEILDYYKRTLGSSHYDFNGYSASKWIGKETFDCSGLVVYALYQLKLVDKDYVADSIYHSLCNDIKKEELQPGDLCFVKGTTITHVAIFVGDGKVVHARGTFYGVVETALFSSFNVFGRLKCFKDENAIESVICKKVIKVTSSLNVRQLPDATSNVLGQLKNGDIVQVTGKINKWFRIEFKGFDAYISGDYTEDLPMINIDINKINYDSLNAKYQNLLKSYNALTSEHEKSQVEITTLKAEIKQLTDENSQLKNIVNKSIVTKMKEAIIKGMKK
jgi:cell wall-associated NlpC family hydrolase